MNNLVVIQPNHTQIVYQGRFSKANTHEYICSFPGSSISIHTNSDNVTALIVDYAFEAKNPNYVSIIVDGKVYSEFALEKTNQSYTIFTNPDKKFHTIEIFKRTESLIGNMGFKGFILTEKAEIKDQSMPTKKILFVGNSITCGYGNEGLSETDSFEAKTENAYMSFASITGRELQAQYQLIAFSGKGIYRNWADTVFHKETLPFIFERTLALDDTIQWNHSEYQPNLIVLNIGTNDFSPPLGANKELYCSTYLKFLTYLLSTYPNATFICLNSQMLTEPQRSNQIEWIQEIIQNSKSNRVHFCKLSLQGGLGYGSDWHPNIPQNKFNAKELVDFIKEKGL